jgi:alpha-mannosidase
MPTGLTDVPATAGTAFGLVGRHAPTINRAYPRGPVPQHRPSFRRGSPGGQLAFLAFFSTNGRQNDVTLTCARRRLSRGDLPTRPGHAAWPAAIPAAQCIGSTRIDLALAAVSAADVERGDVLPRLWEDAFLPLNTLWLRDAAKLQLAPLDIALEGNGLVFSALKPAQIGPPMVLRYYNATPVRCGRVAFDSGGRHIACAPTSGSSRWLEQHGNLVQFVAEPHEIVSIMVT